MYFEKIQLNITAAEHTLCTGIGGVLVGRQAVGRVVRGRCRLIDHGERHDEKPEERDTEKRERDLTCPRECNTTGGSCAPP